MASGRVSRNCWKMRLTAICILAPLLNLILKIRLFRILDLIFVL